MQHAISGFFIRRLRTISTDAIGDFRLFIRRLVSISTDTIWDFRFSIRRLVSISTDAIRNFWLSIRRPGLISTDAIRNFRLFIRKPGLITSKSKGRRTAWSSGSCHRQRPLLYQTMAGTGLKQSLIYKYFTLPPRYF